MLSKSQKESIRRIGIFEYACRERKGHPITHEGKDFIIPAISEIKETAFQEILKLGFSNIEKVEPNKANCIVRIFKKLHYHYDNDLTYNIYGYTCFTLKAGSWVTHSLGAFQDFKIDYSKHILRHWLCQDEYIDFDLDFFDCYVKIS